MNSLSKILAAARRARFGKAASGIELAHAENLCFQQSREMADDGDWIDDSHVQPHAPAPTTLARWSRGVRRGFVDRGRQPGRPAPPPGE